MACMVHARPSVLTYILGYVKWRRNTTKACNKSKPLDPLHPQHPSLIFTQKMALSSDQISSTPTPTNPDLHLSTKPQSNSHLLATPTMNNHTPSHPVHVQEMADLKQIWSGLSLEHLQEETVSFVRIPVHPQTAMLWNQVSQTPSLPLQLEPPSHPPPSHRTRPHARVVRSGHPYHPPARTSRALPIRQWSIPISSSSAKSPDPLPVAIFRFLDRSEINIAMREDEPYLYIVMFSNRSLPFVVSGTHWARLDEVEALYSIKTITARHQCLPLNAPRTPPTWGVPNDSLTPYSSSMKMIAWNCQGVGNEMFREHAYELHRRHRPNILIIIEPHIAEARAQDVIDTLPYTHSHRVDPTGYSGGIWLLWNESPTFFVEIITRNEHSIHALVKVHSPSMSFLSIVVYAPPQFHKRILFWEYLQNLARHISLPWVILGDFNDMIYEDEKHGGIPVNRTRISAFRNCMDKCGLMDLGFHNPRFTWTNKSLCWQTTIKERLDSGLGNSEWATIFPSAELYHLPRVKSDHCPILLSTDPRERKPPKPFRFEQMWFTDPSFPTLINESWKALEQIPSASSSLSRFPRRLDTLTEHIKAWSKNHFGNLFQRKTCLLARLRGIQVALARNPSPFLYSLEHQLTQEYNTTLHQEYLFWRLKSRIMWLNYGDANTKYFHLKTIQRRSQSRVITLKDDTGLWLNGESLAHHIHTTFKKLFQAST